MNRFPLGFRYSLRAGRGTGENPLLIAAVKLIGSFDSVSSFASE